MCRHYYVGVNATFVRLSNDPYEWRLRADINVARQARWRLRDCRATCVTTIAILEEFHQLFNTRTMNPNVLLQLNESNILYRETYRTMYGGATTRLSMDSFSTGYILQNKLNKYDRTWLAHDMMSVIFHRKHNRIIKKIWCREIPC